MKPIFITGIGTDVGKTVIASILVEKLKADYWKPVQSGDLDNSDTMKVQRLISNTKTVFHPESYRLTQPFSPHKSADLDGVEINLQHIKIPESTNQLVIEGAGGLMVPLNKNQLIIDLIKDWSVEVILVSRNYLGSINHTLLSIQTLKSYNIPIKGIIINGIKDEYSEQIIRDYYNVPLLGHIPQLESIEPETIKSLGEYIHL